MSKQQYINRRLTRGLRKLELAIREGEFEGLIILNDKSSFPQLVYKVIFYDDAIGTKKRRRKGKDSDSSEGADESVGDAG